MVPGQIVTQEADHLLMHDNTSAIVAKVSDDLKTYGLVCQDLPVIAIDHVVPAVDEKTAIGHAKIRSRKSLRREALLRRGGRRLPPARGGEKVWPSPASWCWDPTAPHVPTAP